MKSRSTTFNDRKQAILKELSKPDDLYSDLSPKGAVDHEIRELVDAINSYKGLVTTSSCSGRISVFVEGNKGKSEPDEDEQRLSEATDTLRTRTAFASDGGKGGGGRWLYVSHEPIAIPNGIDVPSCTHLFGLGVNNAINDEAVANPGSQRFIHFKFEPMILHVLAASPTEARHILAAAHEAGFRESGAANVPADPTVTSLKPGAANAPISIAIRTSGLAFDNIIGMVVDADDKVPEKAEFCSLVSEKFLCMLVGIANTKFKVNSQRKKRFGELLGARMEQQSSGSLQWENNAARRERKQREGLDRKERLRQQQ